MQDLPLNEYLANKTGLDIVLIDKLFYENSDEFEVAHKLIDKYGIEREKLGKIWGDYLGFAYVDPNKTIINHEYIDKIGLDFIRKNKVMPLYKFGKAVTVCISDPKNLYMQDKLEKKLGEIVSLVFCFPFDVEWCLFKLKL
jgi:hypothetical protein